MYTVPEQVVSLNKANIDTAMSVAAIAMATTEGLFKLNMAALKDSLNEAAQNANVLADVKEAKDLMSLQSSLAQPGMDKAIAYSRSVYEVVSKAQSQLTQLAEGRMAEVNKEIVSAMDKAAKSAPAGSEVAVAAVKSAMTAATTAFDTLSKTAKQVVDLAEAGVNTVAATPIKGKKAA
jgi:phasin family protein